MNRSKIVGSAPILLVKDVEKSANYSRDKVGFKYDRFWGDPPGFCILNRDGFNLMLSRVNDSSHIVPHYKIVKNMWNVYFWVDDAQNVMTSLWHRVQQSTTTLKKKPMAVWSLAYRIWMDMTSPSGRRFKIVANRTSDG